MVVTVSYFCSFISNHNSWPTRNTKKTSKEEHIPLIHRDVWRSGRECAAGSMGVSIGACRGSV